MSEVDPIVAALNDLLSSEGWRIFKESAAVEWGPGGYGRRMQEALSTVPHGPDRPYELARIAEQVDATARAVEQIVAWPSEEVRRRAAPKQRAGVLDHLRRGTR
jgi:hypothetical protein